MVNSCPLWYPFSIGMSSLSIRWLSYRVGYADSFFHHFRDTTVGFLFGLLSIGAIICGVLGINESGIGKKKGRGMAIAGLVLGCVALVVWLIRISVRRHVWGW
jgi:hypothetical protein